MWRPLRPCSTHINCCVPDEHGCEQSKGQLPWLAGINTCNTYNLNRMSSAFTWWRTYAVARRALTGRAALAGSKLRRLRLDCLFSGWRDLTARFAAARRGMAAACRRMQVCGGR